MRASPGLSMIYKFFINWLLLSKSVCDIIYADFIDKALGASDAITVCDGLERKGKLP